MENKNPPWEAPANPAPPSGMSPIPEKKPFPTGGRELIFGICILVIAILLCNSVLYGGFNLGFAVMGLAALAASAVYLLRSGKKPGVYPAALLILSAVILASFARSDDGFVKFVMVCFLLVCVNLALALTAGKNLQDPAGVGSLLDAPRTAFVLGLGRLEESFRGLGGFVKGLSSRSKTGAAVLLGLLIAVPVLAVLIPLLMSADAAFDGLLALLPDFRLSEAFLSCLSGIMLAAVLYTRGTALLHDRRPAPAQKARRGVNHVTVMTVMGAVCLLYVVYLFSQLAYFVGGFSGILPEGFTPAQYARRGFFEMAWLCAIDLTLITLAVGLVRKQDKAPLALRLECLFVGLVTLFFVTTASAKMFLYIGVYSLTRLRVLTEVIMVFLGLTTAVVCLWLFLPKLPYMKIVLIAGLVIGAAVAWVDVDTVVARYNVRAYQSGKSENVDVAYLSCLSDGAVPYLDELAQCGDPEVANKARQALRERSHQTLDLRSWNVTGAQAEEILQKYAH